MFIGHFGVALALKRAEPRISLGWLIAAAQFVDLLWPVLLLLGLEHVRFVPGLMAASPMDFESYPYSHSLLAAILWAVIIYLLVRYLPIAKNAPKPRAAWILAIAVLSHWFLDLLVHRPDLPLAFGDSPKVGLGIWNSLPATLAIEFLIYIAGFWLYLKTTRAVSFRGRWGIWIYVVLLAALFLITALSQQPPPSVNAMAVVAILSGLTLAFIAAWLDTGRVARTQHST
jgi:hypothetical protein